MILCTTITELAEYEYIIHWVGAYLYCLPMVEYKKEILRGNIIENNTELVKILCFNALIVNKFNTAIDPHLETILREHIMNEPRYDIDYFINQCGKTDTTE